MVILPAASGLIVAWAVLVFVATPAPTPPATQHGVAVPASVDATGASDASAALASFIASVPDGSTIVFQAGGVYRLDEGLRLLGRRDLTFEGAGATLQATATSGQPRTSPFLLEGGANLTIRDFTLLGTNPDAGTADSHHLDRQDQGGVNAYGVQGLLIEHTTIRGTWGDCVYVGAHAGTWSDGVTFRDSVCERNGRMGVAIVAARNTVVERVAFDAIAMFPFDIEPDDDSQGAIGVTFRDNTVGTYGHSTLFTPYFFAAEGAAGATVRDVTVIGNRVTGGTLASTAQRPNRSDFTFADNVSLVAAHGPVLYFGSVRGLTVSGNVQPLASGELLDVPGPSRTIIVILVGVAAFAAFAVLGLIVIARRWRGRRATGTGGA